MPDNFSITEIENESYGKSSTTVIGTNDNQSAKLAGMANVGELIRAEREKRGWSQERLAREIGVSQPAIKKIEAGDTQRSKYLPEILHTLGISSDHLPQQRRAGPIFNQTVSDPQPVAHFRAPPEFMNDRDTMPVFASAEGGPGEIIVSIDEIDRVPRPYTLEGIPDAYAILITGESMWPAYKPGDYAWVNPRLPPQRDTECILYALGEDGEARATIKNLLGWTDTEWKLEQYNPPKKFSLQRSIWIRHHRVVGNFRRR